MSVGGVGVVSVAAHLVGTEIKAMIDAFAAGSLHDARRQFIRLQPLFAALFLESNPIPIKAALQLVGKDAGTPRLPLVSAEASTIETIRVALSELA
jgi:4-hydroxy-tetrahydrodipicolinate synthase